MNRTDKTHVVVCFNKYALKAGKQCFTKQIASQLSKEGSLRLQRQVVMGTCFPNTKSLLKCHLAFVREDLTNHGTFYKFSGSQKAVSFEEHPKNGRLLHNVIVKASSLRKPIRFLME